MKSISFFSVLFLFFFFCCSPEKSDMEIIRNRIASEYLNSEVDDGSIKTLIETVNDDGTWPEIDYVDTSRTAFQHSVHYSNMIKMAVAYRSKKSVYRGDKNLKRVLDLSLNYWLANDFLCENWWFNQIGTPSSMLNIMYLLDKELTQEQTEKMLQIAGRANMNASGARPSGDRIVIAGLLAKTALFKRDTVLAKEVLDIIEGEMKFYSQETEVSVRPGYFSGGRGLQRDYSFHHRPDRVNNTTTYGLSCLNSFVEWAVLVSDTKYSFSEKSIKLAIDYFLDGICKQMVYGKSVDPGALNRDISRQGAGGKTNSSLPEKLLQISDYRKDELENIIKARNGESFIHHSFAKFFWQTEYFVFQRPTFFTSVRMFSTRNRNMEEPYNGEGLLNHFRADGTNYLSMTGDEYFNLAPVTDYLKIPGATTVQLNKMPDENQIQKSGKTDFVGGVFDGLYGAAVFDFDSPHTSLTAKKSWFFFDDAYICLGAGIRSSEKFPVYTTLNQCFLRGDVMINDGTSGMKVEKGERVINGLQWVYHDNVGYLFPSVQKVFLSNKEKTGSWFRINRQASTSKKDVKEDVFSLCVDHGIRPSSGTYAYVVLPATDITKVEKYVANPEISILANTEKIQAVKTDKIAYSTFYVPGELKISEDLILRVDSPCMVMLHYNRDVIESMSVADPSRKLASVKVSVNKHINTSKRSVVTNRDGAFTTFTVVLPTGDYAGSSITLDVEDGPITDDEAFFNAVNLDYPGLEKVKQAVEKKDYATANIEFVAHLKSRTKPVWHFDWHDFNKQESRDASYNCREADKIASNLLQSCGVPYQFGEEVEWSINPTPLQYKEWTWQLSRHPFWTTLGKAYWATGDEKYARAFVQQMRSWIIDNPLPANSGNYEGSRWRTIETGIRTSGSWPNSFFYFLGSPSFDDESVMLMVKSFYEHGLHLRAFPQKNNWLTMEMNGLFHIGILFPEFKKSAEWCEYASNRLHEEEKIQVYDDGAQVELTTGYHGVSLRNFMGILNLASINDYTLPTDYVKRLENMFNYYVNICMPDGVMPALNDAGWGNVRSMLKTGFELFPKRKDFQYIATNGEEGKAPSFTSVWMPWAGWYIMRSGWDKQALYSHFEVGPYGAAHQHEDKLTVLFNAYGKRLLTEGGTYAYDRSQWREYVLSARAHNISKIDGLYQNRGKIARRNEIRHSLSPMQNKWITNEHFDFGEGRYDEGFGPDLDSTVTQYRALLFVKNDYWLLFDVFTPTDEKQHIYETYFHLNTTKSVTEDKLLAVCSNDEGEANIAIVPLHREALSVDIIKGQVEPEVQGWIPAGGTDQYKCKPIATPTFKRQASGQVVEPYLFYPMKAGESLPVSGIKASGNSKYEILFKDGRRDIVELSLENKRLKTLQYTIISSGGETKTYNVF